jgi:hypothetical protein
VLWIRRPSHWRNWYEDYPSLVLELEGMVAMFKPEQVRTLPNYRLWVRYADGIEGEVDLGHLVGQGVFALWNDLEAFERVYIGSNGQIAWSDEIDICADAIYMKITGKTPEELFPSLATEVVRA